MSVGPFRTQARRMAAGEADTAHRDLAAHARALSRPLSTRTLRPRAARFQERGCAGAPHVRNPRPRDTLRRELFPEDPEQREGAQTQRLKP